MLSKFIGRQLSRFKLAINYIIAISSVMTTMGILEIAFNFPYWINILFLPVFLLFAVILGYFLDNTNISSEDAKRTIDIQHRTLNNKDFKEQQFFLMLTKLILDKLDGDNEIDNLVKIDKGYAKYKKGVLNLE